MKVLIYHPSSFGGTYDYALQLLEAYGRHPEVEAVSLLLPRNARASGPGIRKTLADDLPQGPKLKKRLQFLWRIVGNPLQLWQVARRQGETLVVFNEFEQLTAFLWAPLFRHFFPKSNRLAAVLHDPDRDAYPPNLFWARQTMRWVMAPMHLGLYHEVLPERPYYAPNGRTRYLNVPHGVFPLAAPERQTMRELRQWAGESYLMALAGNIRPEKNYWMAIELLADFPQLKLVIAGRPANSGVDTRPLKARAEELGASERILWKESFLPDEVFSAVLAEADIAWLNYGASFRSMSAVLNQLAHFRTPVLAAGSGSPLALLVERFQLGKLTQPDDLASARQALGELIAGLQAQNLADWQGYQSYATWDRQVEQVLKALRES